MTFGGSTYGSAAYGGQEFGSSGAPATTPVSESSVFQCESLGGSHVNSIVVAESTGYIAALGLLQQEILHFCLTNSGVNAESLTATAQLLILVLEQLSSAIEVGILNQGWGIILTQDRILQAESKQVLSTTHQFAEYGTLEALSKVLTINQDWLLTMVQGVAPQWESLFNTRRAQTFEQGWLQTLQSASSLYSQNLLPLVLSQVVSGESLHSAIQAFALQIDLGASFKTVPGMELSAVMIYTVLALEALSNQLRLKMDSLEVG